jgi:hypothetical protein
MDDECLILFPQDAIEENVAGVAFLRENAADAHAGVHEEAEGEGEIGLLGKILDGLRVAIFGEDEIVFSEIGDELALFVADGGEDVDDFYFDGDFRILLATKRCAGGEKEQEDCERGTRLRAVREFQVSLMDIRLSRARADYFAIVCVREIRIEASWLYRRRQRKEGTRNDLTQRSRRRKKREKEDKTEEKERGRRTGKK